MKSIRLLLALHRGEESLCQNVGRGTTFRQTWLIWIVCMVLVLKTNIISILNRSLWFYHEHSYSLGNEKLTITFSVGGVLQSAIILLKLFCFLLFKIIFSQNKNIYTEPIVNPHAKVVVYNFNTRFSINGRYLNP